MKYFFSLYTVIVLLALYGDIFKRFLPPMISLILLYGLACLILVCASFGKKVSSYEISRGGELLYISSMALIFLYSIQILFPSADFIWSLSHAVYMIVPLSFIAVFSHRCNKFDLTRLVKIFFLLMIPINFIGLIQYYVDPNFLISTAYTDDDLGGVILRNFLEGTYFSRYPSIFASADRYSAIGLMQFYFTLIEIRYGNASTVKSKFWILFNLVSSMVALLVAGARSRILIAGIAFSLVYISYVVAPLFTKKSSRRELLRPLFFFLALSGGVWLYSFFSMFTETEGSELFPVITLLLQSIEKGDFGARLLEAFEHSIPPEGVQLIGFGLGSIGFGKPGEFGIESMWLESGIIMTIFMLLMYLLMLYSVLSNLTDSFFNGKSLDVGVLCIPLLLFIFALLAGLTSTFELSTGVLIGCTLPVLLRRDKINFIHGNSKFIHLDEKI